VFIDPNRFDILERSVHRVRARTGNDMPLKLRFALSSTLLIFCVAMSAQTAAINTLPSREVGQPIFPRPNPLAVTTRVPNLVEGRELFLPAAVALDTTASPPVVYVADFGNNRVMAWKNASSFSNGKPADLIIGQKDQYSTDANGPTISTFTTGLAGPAGLAVLNGDLYVADSGNNRVLRFRSPFSAPAGQQQFPDLCLGQTSFQTRTANAPNGVISEKGISSPGALRFDSAGNLWVADTGNNRVLEYLAADISKSSTPFGVVAKLEIGQLDLISKADPLQPSDAQRINQLQAPTAVAFDSAGRLYIADASSSFSRVLVFKPPFTSGMGAARIMGIPQPQPQGVVTPDPQLYSVLFGSASDIFFLPGTDGMGVVDANFHRIMIFDVFDKWPDPTTAISPSAKIIVGHASGVLGINSRDQKSLVSNDGNPTSSPSTFSVPEAAIFFNNELYLADAGNNRVIVLPYATGTFQPAVRLLGQDLYTSNAPNLIEGREFDFQASSNGSTLYDAAVVVDSTTDTPHLYVSDPYNNRVLGFKDLRKLVSGSPADIVIGQPDFYSNVCNNGSADRNTPSQSGLCRPMGLLVDSAGNLYVADAANGRVLRFPTPFSHGNNQMADLVLGQPSFFIKITDPSASTMGFPYGLAFAGANGILVSDQAYSRVLYIPYTNGSFTSADNGKAATKVLGQPDFTTVTSGTADTALNSPRHIATDSSGRPYLADTGNSRILIFDDITRLQSTGAHPSQTLSGQTGAVTGIYVNQVTGQVWVADITRNRIVKFPEFGTLVFNPAPIETDIQSVIPIALTQDQYGDLIVAEGVNRVTFYFPGLSALNGANFSLRSTFLAPNTLAALYPATGGSFGKDTADLSSVPNPIPLPTVLADVQVMFDGVASPLYYASPSQINFVVPWGAQTGPLPSEIDVVQVSTGRLLASGLVPMNTVSPGVLTSSAVSSSQVQAAVINQDGSVNSSTHPANRGDIVSIFATGQGFLQGHPADGANPPSPISTDPSAVNLRVLIGACFLDTCQVQPTEKVLYPNFLQYSGTTAYPGLWQINVQVPQITDPTKPAAVALVVNGYTSNGGSIGTPTPVIFVK
jgi:uncharacterized protein (TIGR03437 family)